jgi:hypothetical protein
MKTLDDGLLRMALVGYESELLKIDGKIAELRRLLDGDERRNGRSAAESSAESVLPVPKRRRQLSAATRKRMAESQRKRWAAATKKTARTAK